MLLGLPLNCSIRMRVAVAFAAVFLALLFVFLTIEVLPEALASTSGLTAKAKAEEIGRTRTAILALLAGGIAVVGAFYTARTYGLNRRGQITERFIRGVEQLGEESLGVRVGGIYALGIVAGESRSEHRAVMETLAAHVREHSALLTKANDPARFPLDLQAAMVVLAGRNREFDEDELELDLSRANLSYLRLEAGADLRGLNLTGARLDHAHLRTADLSSALLSQATLDFARLDGARLTGAELYGASLERTWLSEADLGSARLSGANLEKARMNGADLRGAWLRSFDGHDRTGEPISYLPARLGPDGSAEAAFLQGARYDVTTEWPNMPPGYPFDPDTRGAKEVAPNLYVRR